MEDYVIYVGGKPLMNYVTAVVMQFTMHNAEKIVLRTRGKFMNRAIDIAEIVRHRFLKDQVEVREIKIDSEEFKNKEGRTVRVSTLDIEMARTGEVVKTAKKAVKKDTSEAELPRASLPTEQGKPEPAQ